MLRGLYMAACGMLVESTRSDVIANNLANVNTTGFKKDATAVRSFPEVLISRMNDGRPARVGPLAQGTVIDEIRTYHGAGTLVSTSRGLDAALPPNGFFVVDTPNGERYTRSGSFDISSDGYLVTTDGYPVLGENGLIFIDLNFQTAGSLQISENGDVMLGEEYIDRLLVAAVEDTRQMQKQGSSLYSMVDPEAAPEYLGDYKLKVGFLESSNVNLVSEMVSLITAMRAFEAGSRIVQAYDSTLDRAVNDIARV